MISVAFKYESNTKSPNFIMIYQQAKGGTTFNHKSTKKTYLLNLLLINTNYERRQMRSITTSTTYFSPASARTCSAAARRRHLQVRHNGVRARHPLLLQIRRRSDLSSDWGCSISRTTDAGHFLDGIWRGPRALLVEHISVHSGGSAMSLLHRSRKEPAGESEAVGLNE